MITCDILSTSIHLAATSVAISTLTFLDLNFCMILSL